MVFESLWKTFDLRFQGILENLRRHRDLIDQEANAMNIAESKAWRDGQLHQIREWRTQREEEIRTSERERHSKYTRDAVAWLNASEDQEDILIKLLKRCDTTSRHWAVDDGVIDLWLKSSHECLAVWLNGKPGSGR